MLPSKMDVSAHSILGTVSDFYQQQALEESEEEKEELVLSLPPIFQRKTRAPMNQNIDSRASSHAIQDALNSPTIPSLFSPQSKKNRHKSAFRDLMKGQKIEKTKENRKLQQLLKGDRIYATREERVLKRWERQQKKWKSMKKNIANKIGKKEDELVITRAEEWREMIEEIDLMTKSIPISALSSNHWQHSLRKKTGYEETTHLVPIGNMFSGLYCKVTHNPKKPMKETVRKPRKLSALSGATMDNIFHYNLPGKGAASKHWRERSVTYQFRKKLHKKMTQLKPNNLDELDGLEIVGRNMFEMEQLQLPTYSYERFMKTQVIKYRDTETDAPSCQDTAEVYDNDKVAAEVGPSIHLNPENVILFDASLYEEQTKVLQIRNTGTTAMLLRLENVQQIFKENAIFLYPTEQFSILPGDTKRIAFYFRPSKPGSYHLVIGIESFPRIAQEYIQLQGICVIKDEDKIHRNAFIQQMRNKQIEHDVANMVNDMIQSIPAHDTSIDRDNVPKSFCQINREHKLYWYPEILDELQTLSKTIISKFRRRKRNSYQWDLSVTTLQEWFNELEGIQPGCVIQELDSQLCHCIERAQVIPPPNPLYYDLCASLLNDLALQIPRFSWKASQFADTSYKNDMKQQAITDKDTESDTSSTAEWNVFESEYYRNKLYQHCNEYLYRVVDEFENSVTNENKIDDTHLKSRRCKLDLKPQRIITFGDWANDNDIDHTTSESVDPSPIINHAEIKPLYNHCINCIYSNSKVTIMTSFYKIWICSNKQSLNTAQSLSEENEANDEDETEIMPLNDWNILPIFKGFNAVQVFCGKDTITILTDTGDVYCSVLNDLELYQTEVLYNKNIIKITGCPLTNTCVALSECGDIFEWSLTSDLVDNPANEDVDAAANTESTENTEIENKESSERLRISEVKEWTQIERKVIDIAITNTAYAAITDDEELIIWGDFSAIYSANVDTAKDTNQSKKKKDKSKSKKKENTSNDEDKIEPLSPYTVIEQKEGTDVKYTNVVSCSNTFIVLDRNGNVYSFGKDECEYGSLGLGREMNECLQPTLMHFENDSKDSVIIQSISSWTNGCCAIDNDSNVWYWGKYFSADYSNNNAETDEKTENENENENDAKSKDAYAFYKPTQIKIDAQYNEIKKMIVTNTGGFLWC